MLQLKFYGIGGQGVVTGAKVLSKAVSLYEDEYAVTVPSYGHERRGAPVYTSVIVDKEPVLLNSFVYEPDVVIVFDTTLPQKNVNVAEGIHEGTVLVLNTDDEKVAAEFKAMGFQKVLFADGSGIAQKYIGRNIPNSSMLGAIAKAGVCSIDSIAKAVKDTFGKKAGDKNADSARETYETTREM